MKKKIFQETNDNALERHSVENEWQRSSEARYSENIVVDSRID